MRDYPHQAQQALRLYVERSRSALAALQRDDFAGAIKFLRLRKAAFHNFRANDALAAAEGFQIERDAAAQQLAQQAGQVDQLLISTLTSHRDQTAAEVTRMSHLRGKISRYKSGEQPSKLSFEQQV